MQLHSYNNAVLAQKAGAMVNEKIKLHSKSHKLLLLSGGSSLSFLSYMDETLLNPSCTIMMSDERYSTNPKINNFLLLAQTAFYSKAKKAGVVFIDSSIQNGESMEEMADRLETSLKTWVTRGGAIIATMGMGPDGHTCGMMPFPEDEGKFENLFESRNLVASYDAENKNEFPLRVTVTMPLVLQITHAIVYIQGEHKREALERALAPEGTLAQTPARIWKEMNDVEILTDIKI